MTSVKLPPLPRNGSLLRKANSYQSSYKRDYEVKGPVDRTHTRPTSSTRKHNPQPKRVFLLRRMFNDQPVCNVWTPSDRAKTPSGSSVILASKALLSCAQHSYRPPLGHSNFSRKPTRFGANKEKLVAAVGIVPVTSVWENDLAGKAVSEPLSMDVKGQRRKLTSSYVMDQHLSQYRALEDMQVRARVSKERYVSQAVKRPCRRKLLLPRPPSLRVVGSTGASSGNQERRRADKSLVGRWRGEFYSLHQPWPACYSCWAGPV